MTGSVRRPPPRRPPRAPGAPRLLLLRCAVVAGAALTVGAAVALPQPRSAHAIGTAAAVSPLAGLLHPHPKPGPVPSTASADPSDGTATGDGSPAGPSLYDSSVDNGSLNFLASDTVASALGGSGIPQVALDAYRRAAAAAPSSCGIDWSLVAAIGRVESNHGRFGGAVLHTDGLSSPPILGPVLNGMGTALIPDTDGGRLDGNTAYDRAVGPMQFIPSTWARYAADGNGDGRADPFNIFDAARAAASYLCRAGGDLSTPEGQARAVFAYNHSDSYVSTVLALAAFYSGTEPVIPDTLLPDAVLIGPAIEPVNPAPPPALAETAPPATLATTTPPTTTLATTTPPTTTPPTTTPPTTTPPTTTPPTTTPPTTTPPTTTPPTTTPPRTTPPGGSCPAVPAGLVLDVIDDSGRTGVADRVRTDLRDGGITVNSVTSGTGTPASAIEYPAAQHGPAQQFADAIGAAGYLRQVAVPRITVVLGPGSDVDALLTSLDRFTNCPAATATASSTATTP